MGLADRYIARRNWSALFSAVGLIRLLIWAYVEWETIPDLVSSSEVRGEVVSRGEGWAHVEVSGVDGVFRIGFSRLPLPKIGDNIALVVSIYDDKTESVELDHAKYRREKLGI